MVAIRARDVRALAFCIMTIPLCYLLAAAVFDRVLAAAAATGAYAALILTRPRMVRVFRRLRGERVERSSYYRN